MLYQHLQLLVRAREHAEVLSFDPASPYHQEYAVYCGIWSTKRDVVFPQEVMFKILLVPCVFLKKQQASQCCAAHYSGSNALFLAMDESGGRSVNLHGLVWVVVGGRGPGV